MTTTQNIVCLNLLNSTELLNKLKENWTRLEATPNVFRYKLNVEQQQILPGNFHFLVQLNSDRTTKRRPPQKITSIQPTFNHNEFNFNKINPMEVLLTVKYGTGLVTFLVNNSPLTKYHSLICPDLEQNQPQILTAYALRFSIDLLEALNDRKYKIGYNSPGALASVNHLHLHLIYLEEILYIEDVDLKHIQRNVYKIDDKYPANGFCIQIDRGADSKRKDEICCDAIRLIDYLCQHNIPHNIFITYGKDDVADIRKLKIYIFPRDSTVGAVKEFSSFNIAFCELSGYVPVGNTETYESLTEMLIIDKIRQDIGNVTERIFNDVQEMYTS